ncbi:histidine kinase dimerization/phospho-acceptor domain-containing protein [Pantoea sp. 18069]|uniref:histidine kinase dimerization/phospho-acceptor domain-containing protein n=1 Tax=Pantoea sp. 18069 TaxID=2681415 RepID=UPI00135C8646|nr:histidine kinase dimerization/phospho-acceptor domain-containing protein [Pantoea sp. 18069]
MAALNWWRNSLHLRLAGVQTLVVAMVLLVVGVLLFQVLQARVVASDHALLQRKARWVGGEGIAAGEGMQGLRQRLEALHAMHPGLRSSLRTSAEADAALTEQAGERPVRILVVDGEAFDTLDLQITVDRSIAQLRLMSPTAPRQSALRHFRRMILALGGLGIVIAAVLSVPAMRWSGRRLRQLSREAHAAGHGGRLSTANVDAELLELVEAFNSTLDQRETAYRLSEGFSADVAHELRSPLATLIGGTQLALSRPRSTEQLRDALASNLEELELLKKLVNDMLFLARADRGERAQSLERADLGELADGMINYCSALLDEAGLTAMRRGSASAVCNPALIRRAIANLLSNAIRHAQVGRCVELHLQALPGKVRIWVFNAGTPIPHEVAARMFDRFFRASAARVPRARTIPHAMAWAWPSSMRLRACMAEAYLCRPARTAMPSDSKSRVHWPRGRCACVMRCTKRRGEDDGIVIFRSSYC